MLYLLLLLAILLLVFGPKLWVRFVMSRYSTHIDEMPGTGGKLAEHLVEQFELQGVKVESTEEHQDHYDPSTKTVRLSPSNYDGKSLTAVAVAAHEVGHAIQFDRDEPLIKIRTRLAPYARVAERIGVSAFMFMPVILAVTRVPHAALIMTAVGVLSMLSAVLFHLITLPVEWDASFNKALPILTKGRYVAPGEEKAVRKVLKAAAFTYVAAALADLLSLWRWLIILRR